MNVAVVTIIEQAIRYERGLADLYNSYHHLYHEDSDFWWDLSLSELSHASLLESGRTLFNSELEAEVIEAEFDELVRTNDELESLRKSVSSDPPSRKEALRQALELENSENEKILHRIFTVEIGGDAAKVANKIRQGDLHHARQIRAHAEKCGLDLGSGA